MDDWYFDSNTNIITKAIKYLSSFRKRLTVISSIKNRDIVWIEYELFPYFGSFAERYLKRKGIPIVFDYDDAIFHNYDNHKWIFIRMLFGSKIKRLLQMSAGVITGSPYLTEYAKKFNKHIIEIPTSLNLSQYFLNEPLIDKVRSDIFVIGWLGSKSTSVNLILIRDAIKDFTANVKAELWLMGFDETKRDLWKGLPVRFFNWTTETEKSFLASIDVGIMPLLDTPFRHGKCGFKLIQYMAMGKPTISTPMEANIKIDKAKINYFANNQKEWEESFRYIYKNLSMYNFSLNREIVAEFYNSTVNEAAYRILFEKLIKKTEN
jgi:glycosyltransferase involved in cell wall biosynthesis